MTVVVVKKTPRKRAKRSKSAKRKKTRARRHAADYYPTPSWCVDRLLDFLWAVLVSRGFPVYACEPCMGDGSIVRAVDRYLGARAPGPRLVWNTNDVRAEAGAMWSECATTFLPTRQEAMTRARPGARVFDLAITNPPYAQLGEAIVRAMVAASDVACALMRLGWFAGLRAPFLRSTPPAFVLVLPQRPSYTGKGTDASEYAWGVWVDGWREPTAYLVLDDTPPEVIAESRAESRRLIAAYMAAERAKSPQIDWTEPRHGYVSGVTSSVADAVAE